MAWYQNYEKEETKHARFSNVEKTDFDKDGYTPLNTFTQKDKDKLKSNEEKYYEFVSWARWYPDLFLDMLRPRMDDGNLGGIDLHFDQRVFLRATLRFYSMYGVFPRGWGKTFCEVAGCFVACILYPGLDLSLTAQSKDASSKLLKDKYNDLMEKYPLLKSELLNISQAKDEVEYKFLNGSRITNLANAQMSKGQRRHRLMIEESALLDSKLFEDVLQPIVDIGRMTKGKSGITDPLEPNHQIHFFTTAGWRNSTEWKRNITFYKGMINCDGSFIIGSDWKLACWFGRGQPKEKILKDKNDSNDALAFAKNYESKWVGATENQLIDINKLMNIRVLTTPVLENKDRKKEIILGVDVARSANNSNNKTAISVVELVHSDNGLIKKMKLVNMYLLSNQMNFSTQSNFIKDIQKKYNAKMVIVDANGLGRGLIDELFKANDEYNAWTTDDSDYCSDYPNADAILFPVIAKAQSTNQDSNSNMIVTFIGAVEGKKLELLEQRKESDFDITNTNGREEYSPYEQTNALVDEITNLKIKYLNGGGVTVEQVLGKIDKDRFSSLMYAVWWALTYDNNLVEDGKDLLTKIAEMNCNVTHKNSNLNNLFI